MIPRFCGHNCTLNGRLVLLRRIPWAVAAVLFLAATVFAQFKAPSPPDNDLAAETNISLAEEQSDLILATRTIAALKRLENMVLVYDSLADFEANGKLARVSFEDFNKEVRSVIKEVERLISRLPESRLKVQITNALYSYRDGAFWWGKIDQPRIINASAFSSIAANDAAPDAALASTIPYTVVIYWRHAQKYLRRAEALISLEQ